MSYITHSGIVQLCINYISCEPPCRQCCGKPDLPWASIFPAWYSHPQTLHGQESYCCSSGAAGDCRSECCLYRSGYQPGRGVQSQNHSCTWPDNRRVPAGVLWWGVLTLPVCHGSTSVSTVTHPDSVSVEWLQAGSDTVVMWQVRTGDCHSDRGDRGEDTDSHRLPGHTVRVHTQC